MMSAVYICYLNHNPFENFNSSSNICLSTDEDSESAGPSVGTAGGKAKSGSTHIHLWQFLKELLASPQIHGSAIRWIDRSEYNFFSLIVLGETTDNIDDFFNEMVTMLVVSQFQSTTNVTSRNKGRSSQAKIVWVQSVKLLFFLLIL